MITEIVVLMMIKIGVVVMMGNKMVGGSACGDCGSGSSGDCGGGGRIDGSGGNSFNTITAFSTYRRTWR